MPETGPWGQVGQRFHDAGINEDLHKGFYSGQKVLSGPPETALRPLAPATYDPHITQEGSADSGPHPYLLAQLPSAGEAGHSPHPTLTFCNQLHDTWKKTFLLLSLCLNLSPSCARNPEGAHSRMWSEKVPLPLPKGCLCWESLPYLPTRKAASLTNWRSRCRQSRSAKARPRTQLPLAALEAFTSQPF